MGSWACPLIPPWNNQLYFLWFPLIIPSLGLTKLLYFSCYWRWVISSSSTLPQVSETNSLLVLGPVPSMYPFISPFMCFLDLHLNVFHVLLTHLFIFISLSSLSSLYWVETENTFCSYFIVVNDVEACENQSFKGKLFLTHRRVCGRQGIHSF